MGEAGGKFREYLKSICSDRSFRQCSASYVPTDLLDRQRQPHPQAAESIDVFADFAAFDLELNVQTARAAELPKSEDKSAEQPEKIERLPVLAGIRKYAGEHVLLLGKPGSGKSTALERLLLQEAELAQADPQAPIPVLLKLRDVRSSVWDLLRLSLESRDPALAAIDLAALLSTGRLLLLWDGVNELPTGLEELQELRQRYRQTPMIFTTRTLSVGSDLGIEKKLEMQPLSELQMRQFTRTYLGQEQGDRLMQRLGQRLREFGETPLLLWMLCGIYDKAGEIPANLGSVFRLFVSIYDKQKQFDQKAQLWQLRFLQALAFAMMPQNDKGLRLSLPKMEAVELFVELLKQDEETNRRDRAIGFLDHLLRHHLLQLKNHNEIEFRHQLFQEYFAAEYLLGQLNQLDDLTLKKLYLNPLDWTESLALMLGICDSGNQALRVVKLALEVDLALGARLAGEVKPQFQQKTVGWIIELKLPEWLKIELLGRTRSEFAVSTLIKMLNDPDSSVRRSAADAIGKIGSPEALRALVQALNDPDSSVRRSAADAIGEIGSPQALGALVQALNDPDSSVRRRAADAIGKIGSPQALGALVQALNHPDSDVRWSAAYAIGEIGSPQALEAFVQALNDLNSFVRQNATSAIGKIGSPQALEALVQVLNDPDISVRRSAVVAVGKIGSPQALEALVQVLNDPDISVRRSAVVAIGEIGSPEALEVLVQALNDPDSSVRRSAVVAVGKIGSPQALEVLVQALNDPDSSVRRSAAEAIGEIGSPQALEVLVQALNHPNSDVRWNAIEAIGKIGSPQALEVLVQVLNHANSDVRRSAAEAIGEIGSSEALEALVQVLNDPDSSVRRSAADAIGKIGSPQALEALMQVLNDPDISVRRSAVVAIGEIGSPQALEALVQALNDLNSSVRRNATSAIGKIGSPKALEVLVQALNHPDSSVRWNAIEAIGEIDSPQALEALVQALNHPDSDVRKSASKAIGEIDSPQVLEALVQVLNHPDSSVRGSASKALGKIGSPQALEALVQVLNDPDSSVRWSAAEAIGKIGSPQALDALMQVLNDPDSFVRWSAAEAIEKIGSPQPLSQLWELSRSGNQLAFYAISKIQKRYRFYNYKIDQTPLPNHLKLDRTTSIIITGGNFGDFVTGNKDVKVRGDYIENQDNTIDSST